MGIANNRVACPLLPSKALGRGTGVLAANAENAKRGDAYGMFSYYQKLPVSVFLVRKALICTVAG